MLTLLPGQQVQLTCYDIQIQYHLRNIALVKGRITNERNLVLYGYLKRLITFYRTRLHFEG